MVRTIGNRLHQWRWFSGLLLGIAAGYAAGIAAQSSSALQAEVTELPRREAFMAGGYFAVTTGLSVACLCLLLVAHVTITERPFAGWSAQLAVMAGALALFVVLALLSGEWSNSPARALVESNRALLYLLMLVAVLNWDVALKLVTLDWAGQLELRQLGERPGGNAYLPAYLAFMGVLCVFPYIEENIRCLRHARANHGAS